MVKEYQIDLATLPRDPALAANCGETFHPSGNAMCAQTAVDSARSFVQDYQGQDLPRARVTRVIRGHRNPANADRLIFRAWRSPDGEYHEERVEKK